MINYSYVIYAVESVSDTFHDIVMRRNRFIKIVLPLRTLILVIFFLDVRRNINMRLMLNWIILVCGKSCTKVTMIFETWCFFEVFLALDWGVVIVLMRLWKVIVTSSCWFRPIPYNIGIGPTPMDRVVVAYRSKSFSGLSDRMLQFWFEDFKFIRFFLRCFGPMNFFYKFRIGVDFFFSFMY